MQDIWKEKIKGGERMKSRSLDWSDVGPYAAILAYVYEPLGFREA